MPGWNVQDLKNYSFYHFEFPQATAIHIAVKHHGSMSFFIPESLTVEKASVAFWAVAKQPENSLDISGPTHGYTFYFNEGEFPWNPDRLVFGYLDVLESGRHVIQVSGNVMLAITIRE